MLSTAEATIQARLTFSLRLTAFVDIEKTWIGKIKDVSIGLKLQGNLESSLEMSIAGELRFVEC